MTLARRIAQWPIFYLGLVLHGVSFLLLLVRWALGRPMTPEEAGWLRDNCGLDVRDNDGKIQTGTYDGFRRLWLDRKRILHELKNVPFELFKSRHDKFDARISGFMLLLTLAAAIAGWRG